MTCPYCGTCAYCREHDKCMTFGPCRLCEREERWMSRARNEGDATIAAGVPEPSRVGCATLWADGRHNAPTCGHHHEQCCMTRGCHEVCSHFCDTDNCLCRDVCNPVQDVGL